jgi:opacity protein-like surface antigen
MYFFGRIPVNKWNYIVQFAIVAGFVVLGTPALANIDDTLFVLGQKQLTSGEITVGYATASSDDSHSQAVLPYSEQKSFPVLDLESFWARESSHLRLDSMVNSKKDYIAELYFDYTGRLRLSLLDESLVHRFENLPLPPSSALIEAVKSDPDVDYDLQFRQQEVALKYSPQFLASHLTLRYHRTTKYGEHQLRYLDENCTTQCHIVSRTRPVDQNTQELFVMADAHLGPLEMSLDHLQRLHDNQAAIPTNDFGSGPAQQHSVLPDNRYDLTTFKIHSSQAGGLVAAAALSAGKRKNESEQLAMSQVQAETDIFKAAGDLTWTPSPLSTFSFRYRITQIDNQVSSPSLLLPEGIDVTRNSFGAAAVLRPTRKLTAKADFQHEQIRREHTRDDRFWVVPEDEEIDRLALDLHYRPFVKSTTRFDLGYLYTRSSDPAYAMSNQNTHVVKAGARISPAHNWGITGNLRGEGGESGGVTAPLSTGQFLFDRTSRKGDASVNAWLSPNQRVTVGTTLGFSHLLVEQDLRFGRYAGTTDVIASDAEMRQIVRTAALNLNLRLTQKVSCSTDLYHVRGSYHFSPEFLDQDVASLPTLTAEGLKDIDSMELRQNGLSAGLNWQLQERLSLGLRYSYDNYHDIKNQRLDATVQSYKFTVTKSW